MLLLLASYLCIFMLSLTFLTTHHPLAMGLTLLVQTCFICITSGVINLSFWFSYILFLIFLGGMLVLFIYVTSLASNETFKFSTMLASFFVWLFIGFFLFEMFFSDYLISYFNTLSLSSFYTQMSPELPMQNIISLIYLPSLLLYTIFMMLYLLLTLIVIVKITNNSQGPLRLSL
uniref:NADH dehydrogenase subunit 6 n=1 Tax=Allanaspides hickmani TaxID=91998 RepID=UPI002A822ECB|nr:NADH dehydrogenase subunit 6 [Allanaspides hickmani]WOR80976.1 NADH dehydrogenase subunit 6 [Allanaspides hickmani]WOR80989.1 NADH dehydrogenase subunit 6 [Allanaspides hickmani]